MVKFIVAMTYTRTRKRPILPYKTYIYRCTLTVGAISGPWALHLGHFAIHVFTWSAKSTLEKQTSRN